MGLQNRNDYLRSTCNDYLFVDNKMNNDSKKIISNREFKFSRPIDMQMEREQLMTSQRAEKEEPIRGPSGLNKMYSNMSEMEKRLYNLLQMFPEIDQQYLKHKNSEFGMDNIGMSLYTNWLNQMVDNGDINLP